MKTYSSDALPQPGRNAAGPAPLRDRVRLVLRGLQAAATEYGLKERHLTVLDMLASFLKELGPEGRPIVFASNQAMSERARGMDVQRIQRVMRDLIEKRLVIRNSSPNGKRYVRRDASGQIRSAFGIDLSPLFEREHEFRDAHDRAQSRQLHRKMLRDELSLIRMTFTPESEEDRRIRTVLRCRSASVEVLEGLLRDLAQGEMHARPLPEPEPIQVLGCDTDTCSDKVPDLDTMLAVVTPDACRIDMHQQRVIQKKIDKKDREERTTPIRHASAPGENLDCNEIARACPTAMSFTSESPRDWLGMVRHAASLAPMIGISDMLSRRALERLGPTAFSAVILCLVERFEPGRIRNPAGYLTRLIAEGSDFCAARFLRGTAKLGPVAA